MTRELCVANAFADLVASIIPGFLDVDPAWRATACTVLSTTIARDVHLQLLAQALAGRSIHLAKIPDAEVGRMLGHGIADDRAGRDCEEVPRIVLRASDGG